MAVEAKAVVRTTIDLPVELNRKLLNAAEKSKRSRHAQMLVALERFFAPDDNGGGGGGGGGGGKREEKRNEQPKRD